MSSGMVLVVEDRENWRKTFCEVLADRGYDTAEAGCGVMFKENADDADVIVLDISMPMDPGGPEKKTTGLEVLLQLQEEHPDHYAIQNPIVRSMWERGEFKNTPLDKVKVQENHWVSRNYPMADMLKLVAQVVQKTHGI